MATRRGPDNTVRVAVEGKIGGVTWANVFWCQLSTTSAIIQSDLDAWLTAFCNAYKTNFAGRCSSGATYSLGVATLFTPGGTVLQSSSTMTGGGTESGTAVADASCCKVLSWLSAVYWRGGKPRTYLPSPVTSDITNSNALSAGSISGDQTAATNFRTAINALVQGTITATQLGFVSFFSGNALRSTPLYFPFTGAKVHPRLGSQRRRLGAWQV